MIRLHMYDHPILTEDILVHEVLNAVKCSRIEMNLLDEAMALVDDPDEVSRDKIDHVYKLLLESGRFQALKNWIFTQKPTILLQIKQDLANDHYLNKSCSCNYLKKAQMSWERKMLRSLNSMCNELGIKLARKRSKCHNEAILQNWGELSIFFNKQSIIKPVFGPKDLLDILTNIKHPHMRPTSRIVHKDCTSALITTWGLINLPLNVKNLLNLREFYYPLHPGNPQIGVDDCELSTFELSREQEAEDVLSLDSSERAQQFLRCGCPLSYRAPIWALCLNAKVVREDYLYYNQLKSFVAENEYMTDELICKEVQLTASNDDMHFVFCDYTYQGILCLCLLFEQLLQIREPEIFFHLKSFGAQPVRFAFKWLMRAFSGFLAPDQVLLLWDRILGFDSLEILAVLAVAIFAYRRTNLLQVKTNADVEAVLADLTPLRVIGLLQMVIFTD
ncbi:TBC1 domain family member 19 [Schistosoma japonicum]|nr:TBC1 domain family member 19 [Schistosoma japonicum]